VDKDKLKLSIEVIAAIGMLGGLLLVAMQLSQNSKLLRTQLLFEENRNYIQWEQAMLGENPAEVWEKSLVAPEELTLSEQRTMEAYYWSGIEQWRSLYRLEEQGLAKEEWKTRVSQEANYLLGSPYGQAYWARRKGGIEDPDFVSVVDEAIASGTSYNTLEHHENIMNTLKESN
jgi:hypothetical protein